MEVLKLNGTATNGKLIVAVPDTFNNKKVEVIVLSAETEDMEGFDAAQAHKEDERIKRLLSIIGTARYPDAVIDKYDVYEQ